MSGCITPQDHGAKGDGIHDDTPHLRAALAVSDDEGIGLFLPRGRYRITAPIEITERCFIQGAPQAVIEAGAPMPDMLRVSVLSHPVAGINIRNIVLDAADNATRGLWAWKLRERDVIDSVYVTGCAAGDAAICLEKCTGAVLQRLIANVNAGRGIDIIDGNHSQFYGLKAMNSGGVGVTVRGVDYSGRCHLYSPRIELNAGTGLDIDVHGEVDVFAPWFEANGGPAGDGGHAVHQRRGTLLIDGGVITGKTTGGATHWLYQEGQSYAVVQHTSLGGGGGLDSWLEVGGISPDAHAAIGPVYGSAHLPRAEYFSERAEILDGVNLVANGSMETKSNWSSSGAPSEQSDLYAHTGAYSWRKDGSAAGEVRQLDVALQPGLHKLRAWVRPDATAEMQFNLLAQTPNKYLSIDGGPCEGGQWTELIAYVMVKGENGEGYRIGIREKPGSPPVQFFLDDVFLERVLSLPQRSVVAFDRQHLYELAPPQIYTWS